jgi:hypothetical protein
MNNPKYDDCQKQAFCLSLLSNMGIIMKRGSVKRLEEQIACGLDLALDVLSGIMGRWKVVWGPAVYQGAWTKAADNTIYVAQSDDGKRYVIAIAASISYYDYMFESFPVWTGVPWPGCSPSSRRSDCCNDGGNQKPCIAAGMYMGLDLLKKIDGENRLTKDRKQCRIYEFLEFLMTEHVREEVEICVTGHSMGAGLSSLLALEMFERQEQWDPRGSAVIKTQPTGGPPVGNKAFAVYSDSKIGKHTTRIWNKKDPVAYAWNSQTVKEIPHLYEPYLKAGKLVRHYVGQIERMPFGNEYFHIRPDTPGLEGNFKHFFLLDLFKWLGGVFNLSYFIVEAFHQHVTEYLRLIELDDLLEFLEKDKAFRLPRLSFRNPLLRPFASKLSKVQEKRLSVLVKN